MSERKEPAGMQKHIIEIGIIAETEEDEPTTKQLVGGIFEGLPTEWFDMASGDGYEIRLITPRNDLLAQDHIQKQEIESLRSVVKDYRASEERLKQENERLETEIGSLKGLLAIVERQLGDKDIECATTVGILEDQLRRKNAGDTFAQHLNSEAGRYAKALSLLNERVPVPNGKWELDHTGGGMTHAAWYGTEDKPIWVAIDDNGEGVTIGAYVGEGVNEMVFTEAVMTDSPVEDMTDEELEIMIDYALLAVDAALAYYYTKGC